MINRTIEVKNGTKRQRERGPNLSLSVSLTPNRPELSLQRTAKDSQRHIVLRHTGIFTVSPLTLTHTHTLAGEVHTPALIRQA